MEADWEVEIGPDAPFIDGAWSGFVDLRSSPSSIGSIQEASGIPGMAATLLLLNTFDSPVWTAKCDVWDAALVDLDEMDAQAGDAQAALACYIDLLAREGNWDGLDAAERFSRSLVQRLRSAVLPCCRIDLVIRRAFVTAERQAFGITVYVTACGRTRELAIQTLGHAIAQFARILLATDSSDSSRQVQ